MARGKKDAGEEVVVSVAVNVIDQPIVAEMRQSYIDYAMTVITGRALPDVRDGLEASASPHPLCHEG